MDMTYRKLLELYKNGQLEDSQREKVERDIERQDAISEYLFNEVEVPGIDSLKSDNTQVDLGENGVKDTLEDEAHIFTKMVNKKIRRAFIKMGLAIGVIILAIVMFVIFALPQAVDSLYYNPSEVAGKSEVLETNRISLDLAVYSEIFLPGQYRDNVLVEENGYGEYDINVLQSASYNGIFTNVGGKLKRDKLTLYDPNLLKKPIGNAFVTVIYDEDSNTYRLGSDTTFEDVVNDIKKLDEEDLYYAFVTLNEVTKYSEFIDWCKKNDVSPEWCSIKDGGVELSTLGNPLGFNYSVACTELLYDKNTYPYLSSFDTGKIEYEDPNGVIPEDVMTTHVVSLYNYMAKQTEFNKMVKSSISSEEYSKIAANVKQNGLNIYGFTVVGKKSDLLKLLETNDVAYIYTQSIK